MLSTLRLNAPFFFYFCHSFLKTHLVELLWTMQVFQEPPVLPLSVLSADERGTLFI